MSQRMSFRPAARVADQRGFILVTAMIFLVVMTLVALAMFRSTGLMDRVSANARDKQRSFEAAQSALAYAEWWLTNNSPKTATSTCGSLVSGDVVTNIHVCNAALASYTTVPFTAGFQYTPPNLTATTGGGQVSSSTSSDVNYYALPGFYIEYLGSHATKGGYVYKVTAYGYGGDGNSISVVRSTFWLPATTTSGGSTGGGLGGP